MNTQKLKRWDIEEVCPGNAQDIIEQENGAFVLYTDVESLQAENKRLQERVRELEEKRANWERLAREREDMLAKAEPYLLELSRLQSYVDFEDKLDAAIDAAIQEEKTK